MSGTGDLPEDRNSHRDCKFGDKMEIEIEKNRCEKGPELQQSTIRMEDVLKEIGGFGRFQFIFSILLLYPQLAAAMVIFSPLYTTAHKVPMYCQIENSGILDECGINCTVPEEDSYVYTSVVQEWELVCSRKWIADLVTSCQMAGRMVGAMVSSIISDRFGRQIGFWWVSLGTAAFGALPAVTTSPIMYAAARFLAGFAEAGCMVVHFAHLMEFLTPSWRVICAWQPLWYVGHILLGPVAYYLQSWRFLTISCVAPLLLLLPFYPLIVESPRWLLNQRRTEEAHAVLQKVAAWNSKPPPTTSTMEQLQAAIIAEQSEKQVSMTQALRQVMRDKTFRLQTIVLVWLEAVSAFVTYGVSFNAKDLSGDPYLNVVYMGIATFIAVTVILIFNGRVGRKKTLFVSMALTALCEIVPVIHNELSDWVTVPTSVVIASVLIGRSIIGACMEVIGCIILETFPTTLRTSCLGAAVLVANFVTIFAPQTAYLNDISESIPYGIYTALSIINALISLLVHETSGVPLKDSVQTDR